MLQRQAPSESYTHGEHVIPLLWDLHWLPIVLCGYVYTAAGSMLFRQGSLTDAAKNSHIARG